MSGILAARRGSVAHAAAPATYAGNVLADSPAAYWKLDETSGTFADATGNGHSATATGTVTTGVTPTAVAQGNAISVVGTGNLVADTLGSFGTAIGAGSSFEFLIKTTTTSATCVLGTLNTAPDSMGVQLKLNVSESDATSAGKTSLWIRSTGGGTRQFSITNSTIYSGAWTHVVFTFTATGSIAAYVNGTSQTTTDRTAFGAASDTGNFQWPLTIGARNNRNTHDLRMTGSLDEVAVYPSVLSSTRVAAHYAALGT